MFTYEPRSTFQNFSNANVSVSKAQYAVGHGHAIHYPSNGTGRDTYIQRYNGGFTKMHQPCAPIPPPGTIKQKPSFHEVRQPPHPVMDSKPVFYRADGTGRDKYIE